MVTIRPYEPRDRADVYDVCVRTADGGGDARGLFSSDDLMPDLFAGPYVALEPELAFVLDDGERVVGYVIGTADTARFAQRYRDEWIPALGDKWPSPADPSTREEWLLWLHHHPERLLVPELAAYPAHLHIDVLPEHQGQGHGRALIQTLLRALHEQGVPAVHLGMVPTNTGARAFYDRLGFAPVDVPGETSVVYLGRATG